MRILFLAPLVICLILLSVFLVKLINNDTIPTSPLIGKSLSQFNLPSVYEGSNLSNDDLQGQYSLINIFASWCLTCKIEHPTLIQINKEYKIPIYGINWKDKKENALKWLEEGGNPYTKIGADIKGQTILDLGVTGAPETFLISPDGIILYRHVGVLTLDIFNNQILPIVKK